MNLALFGATGGTGRQILNQARTAGHTVVALVRDTKRLPTSDPHIRLLVGNVLDMAAVAQTLEGADAVIVSLGNSGNNPDLVVSTGTANIVAEMQRQGIRRVIVISSLGVGESKGQVSFFFRLLMKTFLRQAIKDKELQEEIVRKSGLDWTIVRPGGLTDGPATGAYTVATDSSITAGQVSRADVAAFVLQQVADSRYVHATPAIT